MAEARFWNTQDIEERYKDLLKDKTDGVRHLKLRKPGRHKKWQAHPKKEMRSARNPRILKRTLSLNNFQSN